MTLYYILIIYVKSNNAGIYCRYTSVLDVMPGKIHMMERKASSNVRRITDGIDARSKDSAAKNVVSIRNRRY